jgi:Putative DnaT-like ssDNA binding protein
MALDATVGGVSSNSYVTMSVASAFLDGRLHIDAWVEASGAERESALIWATRLLDQQVRWYGMPTTMTQALAWPMTGMVDRYGRPISPTIVPTTIQEATAVYALALLDDTSSETDSGADTGIKMKKLGAMTIEFFEHRPPSSAATLMPLEVRQMVAMYGTVAGSINVPVLRT